MLFLSLRGDNPHAIETVDLRWIYLLLCVIAESMIQPETIWYYPSLVMLALWALQPPLGPISWSVSESVSGSAQAPGASPGRPATSRG